MTRDQFAAYAAGLATAVTALLVILEVISAEVAGAIVAIIVAAVGGYAVDNHGAHQAKVAVQTAADNQVAPVRVPVEVEVEMVEPEWPLDRPLEDYPEGTRLSLTDNGDGTSTATLTQPDGTVDEWVSDHDGKRIR